VEIGVTSKTKSALAAVLMAAFATPALAQGSAPLYYGNATAGKQATQSQRLIEGLVRDFGTVNGTSTDRDSIVRSLGN
jgi:hypothetical protein